jgi:DNA-binding response OmpR family regulator
MSSEATILIVDDEPDLREVLEEYFVAQDYTALSAEKSCPKELLLSCLQICQQQERTS